MEEKFLELLLPGGRRVQITANRLRTIGIIFAVVFVLTAGAACYFYYLLADYRGEAAAFKEYKAHKEEQRAALRRLLSDNERILQDVSELFLLEKKLLRTIGGSTDESGQWPEPLAVAVKGQGNGVPVDAEAAMGVLQEQHENILSALYRTKASVRRMLAKTDGRSETLEFFPDLWPTEGGAVSSSYGGRMNPVTGEYENHYGLDIAVDFGAPVYAAAAGTVEQAGWNGGYGRFVRIDHGNGYATTYGHMSGLAVEAGTRVDKGRIIGYVGSTGYSTGPHVHYEVLVGGQHIDPYYVLGEE